MKKLNYLLFSISFCFLLGTLKAQDNKQAKIDSLTIYLKSTGEDTNRVMTYWYLAQTYRSFDIKESYNQINKCLALSEKLEFKRGRMLSIVHVALLDYSQGDFVKSTKGYELALQLTSESGNKKEAASCEYHLGINQLFMGDYAKSQEYFYSALRTYESLGLKKEGSDTYGGIANLYGRTGNKKKELEFMNKSLNAKIELKDENGISAGYINMGNFYGRQAILDTALLFYFKGLKIIEKTKNQKYKLNALGNIGTIYVQQGKTKEALPYLLTCLDIAEQMGDKQAQITTLNEIGQCYSKKGEQAQAINFTNRALIMAKEIKSTVEIKNSYFNLSEMYARIGDYKQAYSNQVLATKLADTILNSENSAQINEMQEKYDSEKKEQEIILLNKNKEIQDANSKKQQVIIWAVCAGLFIMFLLSFFIFRQFKEKQKANTALKSAYTEIEEKNKDITDSINYAKRIQTAILPSIENIKKHLHDFFILYQPKDIVSGDFYWFTEKNNKYVIAVADCTGHGVPGAFMSMIGNDFLTQIVIEKGITQPNLILSQLHDGVKNALKQDTNASETKDGMDISIVTLEEKNDTFILEFAGALRPLWVISKGGKELIEYKGDKHSIGGAYSSEQRNFTNQVLTLRKGDSFFLSTDGFGDQFGGDNGKKFMTKNMKELLLAFNSKPMNEQGVFLKRALDEWKQERSQVDDVLVIGVQV